MHCTFNVPLPHTSTWHYLAHVNHFHQIFNSGCFHYHSNASSINGPFPQPTRLGIKALSPRWHHLGWACALDFYLGCNQEIQVIFPLSSCTTKLGNSTVSAKLSPAVPEQYQAGPDRPRFTLHRPCPVQARE